MSENGFRTMRFSILTSHVLFILTLVGMGWLGLGTLFVSALFSYFALDQLQALRRRWLMLLVFFVGLAIFCSGLGYVADQAVHNLPRAAITAIPSFVQFAKEKNLELPFTDWDSLKAFALDTIGDQLHYIGTFTRTAAKHFVMILVGVVAAVSLFLNPKTDVGQDDPLRTDLYAVFWRNFAARFRSFYYSFKVVMKAQLIIATINTGMTSIFLTATSMPYTPMLILITFFCGLLPIIGNLISNSIIVGVGFTVSPQLGIGALAFLILLHKIEYFLNSTVIGQTIQNPMWLTLIGLIVGERVLGITGIILAPVFLYFFKAEASLIEVVEKRVNQTSLK
jgi:predicted PurR-regulated permease PerM